MNLPAEFKCPHGKKVVIKKPLGMTIFNHEDGKPCSVLNTGALSLSRLNKTYLADNQPDILSNHVKATIIGDKSVQEYVIDKFLQIDSLEEAVKVVRELHQSNVLPDNFITFLSDAIGKLQAQALLRYAGLESSRLKNYPIAGCSGYSYGEILYYLAKTDDTKTYEVALFLKEKPQVTRIEDLDLITALK